MKFIVLILLIACTKEEQKTVINYSIVKAPTNQNILAKVGDENITKKEIYKNVENEIFELEEKIYNLKRNRLNLVMLERFMNKHPGKKGLTNDQFLEKYITKKISVSDREFLKFVKKRGIPDAHLKDDIKSRIKSFLLQEAKKKAIEKWIVKQSVKYKVEIYFAAPMRPTFGVTENDLPSFGKSDSKVTVVEYSDFQCPFSKQGAQIISKLKKQYGDRVRIVHKNFPLPFHKNARSMGLASLCAWEQGKFWSYYDELYKNQTIGNEEGLINLAKRNSLKVDKFTSCLKRKKYQTKLDEQIKEARMLGIKSTPTFYVNGKVITGAQKFEVFEELINKELL